LSGGLDESSMSDATIWSITLKSSITILEASLKLICDIYSTGITYDNLNMFLVQATEEDLAQVVSLAQLCQPTYSSGFSPGP
jgi:hypothetical protein